MPLFPFCLIVAKDKSLSEYNIYAQRYNTNTELFLWINLLSQFHFNLISAQKDQTTLFSIDA